MEPCLARLVCRQSLRFIDDLHSTEPSFFSVTGTRRSCRTTSTILFPGTFDEMKHWVSGCSICGLPASSDGRAVPGRRAPPPAAGASRVARCPAWRRTCREPSRPPTSGSACTPRRRPSCSRATPSTAPPGWLRSGRLYVCERPRSVPKHNQTVQTHSEATFHSLALFSIC